MTSLRLILPGLVVAALGCDARSANDAFPSPGAGPAGASNTASGAGAASSTGSTAGTTGTANPEPTSGAVNAPRGGTRLKAVVAEASSGTTQFLGWHDTELDIRCDFGELASGELACLPDYGEVAWTGAATTTIFYADSSCTTEARELVPPFDDCVTPRFAQLPLSGAPDPCQADPTYLKVGDELRHIYARVGDACEVASKPAGSGKFYAVTPFDSSGFVAGALREGAAADGIRPVYVTTPDGAEGFLSFRDAEQGFDCALLELSDGLRCGPTDVPTITGYDFSDDSCQQPAAMAFTCQQSAAESVPFTLEAPPYDDPEAGWRVYEGGVKLSTSYSTTAEGDCIGTELQNTPGVFAVGREIPSSSFVSGVLEEATDAIGLMTVIAHAGGWSAASRTPARNTALEGYDCGFWSTTDDQVRCVPSPSLFPMEYADPACSEGLVAGWETSTLAAFADEQCPARVSVYTRGEEYSGPVYRKDGEVCVFDRDQPPQPSRTIAHRLGAELPAETFPAIAISLR